MDCWLRFRVILTVSDFFLQSSTIVGYDVLDVQPSQPTFYTLDRHKDLARRVKWVHGNLYASLH